MAARFLSLAALAATAVVALPGMMTQREAKVASYEGNPLADVAMWVNPYYKEEIYELALPHMKGEMKKKAKMVAEVPSFQWLDKRSKIDLMESTLADIREANEAGADPPYAGMFVLYNFPDRDCSAKASDGELKLEDDGAEKYKTEYIDPIAKLAKEYSDVRMIIAYEPDGLANLVTNMEVEKCAAAAETYTTSTIHALQQLNLPNIALYLDAGHAGWLGWPSNLNATAEIFGAVYANASSPASVRGLVTNVSNFNAWNVTDRPEYTKPNPNWDESRYHAALAPHLDEVGFPAHFLVDTGRSGAQPAGRDTWGEWCNIKGAGFGRRPSAETGAELLDAFVWVKPGGEADGTSDEEAVRYDKHCSSNSSLVPAPEAGDWFQEYFEMLIRNADPPFGEPEKGEDDDGEGIDIGAPQEGGDEGDEKEGDDDEEEGDACEGDDEEDDEGDEKEDDQDEEEDDVCEEGDDEENEDDDGGIDIGAPQEGDDEKPEPEDPEDEDDEESC